jgi:hypothetical protein
MIKPDQWRTKRKRWSYPPTQAMATVLSSVSVIGNALRLARTRLD